MNDNELNETEFLAMLSNSTARMSVGRYKDELRQELTDMGKYMFDTVLTGVSSEGEMVAALMKQGMPLESAKTFWRKCALYSFLPGNGTATVIGSLDRFVRTTLTTRNLRRFQQDGNIARLVEQTMQLTPLTASCIPVINPAEEDVDAILAECSIGLSIPSTLSIINNTLFGGYLRGQVVCVGGPPGGGKSTFMLQEALFAAEQGYKVYYIAMGDLMKYDIYARSCAMILDVDRLTVAKDMREHLLNERVRKVYGNLRFTVVPSGKISAFELSEFLKHQLIESFDYDMLVVDYDANIKIDDEKHMYFAHGELYDLMSEVARPDPHQPHHNKLVLVGSQVKPQYWEEEIIPLDAYAESSKKGHIIDMGLTVSHVHGVHGHHLGYVNMCKSRRTEIQKPIPYKLSASGRVEEIAAVDYIGLRGNVEKKDGKRKYVRHND